MKTTVEISDWLLREARKLAARKGVTLRSLIESGLRQTIVKPERRSAFSCGEQVSRARAYDPTFVMFRAPV